MLQPRTDTCLSRGINLAPLSHSGPGAWLESLLPPRTLWSPGPQTGPLSPLSGVCSLGLQPSWVLLPVVLAASTWCPQPIGCAPVEPPKTLNHGMGPGSYDDWAAAQLTAAGGWLHAPLCLMNPITSLSSSSGLGLPLGSMFARTEKSPILPHWLPGPP